MKANDRDGRRHVGACRLTRMARVITIATSVAMASGCGLGGADIGSAIARAFRTPWRSVVYADGSFLTLDRYGVVVFDAADTTIRRVLTTGIEGSVIAHGDAGWMVEDYGRVYVSPDGETWMPPNATLGVPHPAGAAFGAGRYVVVGGSGTVAVSEDLASWIAVDSQTQEDLLDVRFLGDRFLAVGKNGTVRSSLDGRVWSSVVVPTSVHLQGCAAGNDVTLVVGDDGTVLRSSDGETFAGVESPTNAELFGVTFALGRFIVVGAHGTILISTDGALTFQEASVAFGPHDPEILEHIYDVAYGNGTFVAVGDSILTSLDGFSWSEADYTYDDSYNAGEAGVPSEPAPPMM